MPDAHQRGAMPSPLKAFRLNEKRLEDSDDLPEPDLLAQEIADDLQTALEQFQTGAAALKT
jgi:type I restriction enzyme M protein